MKVHSIKTDNHNIYHKVELRKEATKDLDELKVLDLFAGENKLWGHFDCQKYYGVEIEKDKGKNLNANNVRVIKSLDLSEFNVIDCDSYGIPVKQIQEIYNNATLKKGTIIIYTCIGNAMSALNKQIITEFHLEGIYKKCKVLLNKKSEELFYGYLYNRGVRSVTEYAEIAKSFKKKYGFFVV